MKRAFLLLLCAVAFVPGLCAADDDSASPDTSGTDTGFTPNGGEIAPNAVVTISFPGPMVPADHIDLGGQAWPVKVTPALDGTFLWKSQTEGQLVVGSVVAGATHHFTVVPGLKDVTGQPVSSDVAGWAADFTTPTFTLATDAEFRKHLDASPRIPIHSTYDVLLTDVPKYSWIQDRDSRARFAVDAIQTSDGPLEADDFEIEPRNPLPPGHTYDLVIDGLPDSQSHQPLPYPAVFPLGDTQNLKIEWIGAFNPALQDPYIGIKFNDSISPDAFRPEMIRVDPDVPNLTITTNDDDEIDITGDFDFTARYHVTVSTALAGERGYPLSAESRWAASFPPRQPCISFPGPRIYLRSGSALHFAFVQSNTPAVTWKLAGIPLEKLAAVNQRLEEYNDSATDPLTGEAETDPNTGWSVQKQTELLVGAFNLPVILSGTFAGTDTAGDVTRTIDAALPAGASLSGPYLIEASSTLPGGRIAGGRALVCFSDYILTQKRTPSQVFLRVARMSDALPVSGVTVRAVTDQNIELGRAVTDGSGLATFSNAALFPPNSPGTDLFIADTPAGPALASADESAYQVSGDNTSARVSNHALIITDRNLYRPGEEVKMKGILRDVAAGGLTIPAPGTVHWQIKQGDANKVIGEGDAPLNATGAFEASWQIPTDAALGACTIDCTLNGGAYNGTANIDIEEYRVPLFSVEVTGTTEVGGTAHIQVASAFFHGGGNSGARVHWKADWSALAETGTNTMRYNQYPEIGPALDPDGLLATTIEGDTRLDANGMATISCDSPFKSNPAVGVSNIDWTADITSIDGQTLSGGYAETFSSTPVILGVVAEEQTTAPRGIAVTLEAVDPDGNPIPNPANVTADLYKVTTKTVKEQVAPLVFRYRNNDEFAKVDSRDGTAPGSILFTATDTGVYAIGVHGKDVTTPLVSAETVVTGEEPAEMPVENDTSFTLETRKEPWLPGDTAVFTVEAPSPGIEWACVETDSLLDSFIIPLSGNAGRIEIPVKNEYAPNATLAVYITRPGGASGLPIERFATVPFRVDRPDRELSLTPRMEHDEVRPGQNVHGEIDATSEGKPVAGADLAVFAVDDAVLKLGDWTLPDALSIFYPDNPYSFTEYGSLTNYVEMGNVQTGFQKGFVIGDGGEETTNTTSLRKEFKTLAYWNASLKTDADGRATFDFTAPDNLTAYRIITIGQTGSNQFGGDASATVKVTKPLLVDPALPRFLRDGDEVELRAVVRESFADSTPITASCVTGSGCTLIAEPAVTGTATRNAPWVLRFRAKVADPGLAPIKVRFSATAVSDPTMSDAVEISIPVGPPTIIRHEAVAGKFNGPEFTAAANMPSDWNGGRGQYALTLSTTPWLPAITGIPTILDYPHGCFEQITSKLLCYSLLANLMDYLPDTEARLASYNAIFQQGVDQIGSSLLDDGRLPYWPGGTEGDDYVTCQACWALNEAANSGFTITQDLADKLSKAVANIANHSTDPDTRAFALFVLASLAPGVDYSAVAEDIYLHRATMDYDGRALLAMALQDLNIMPDAKVQLMAEIDKSIVPTAFKPETFGSMDRTEGICAMAFETIAPPNFTPAKKAEIQKRLLNILESASTLSTQENLWLLLAFKSMLDAEAPPALTAAQPPPAEVSKNGASASWPSRKLADSLVLSGLNQGLLAFLMQADYSRPEVDTARVDRGFRVERVVHDLTDPKRAGTPDAPYRIGDQILITYRIFSERQQYYVALEDSLPAAFETVNPNIAQIGDFFQLPPPDPNDMLLDLSYSEMRDRSTLLYFDDFPSGPGVYSVLARVTAAGTFRWPATQVTPMYDSRFSGLSASSVCIVTAE
jgi:uncharacterized protein YfaS (alpha-2-macroglobulin family)